MGIKFGERKINADNAKKLEKKKGYIGKDSVESRK